MEKEKEKDLKDKFSDALLKLTKDAPKAEILQDIMTLLMYIQQRVAGMGYSEISKDIENVVNDIANEIGEVKSKNRARYNMLKSLLDNLQVIKVKE